MCGRRETWSQDTGSGSGGSYVILGPDDMTVELVKIGDKHTFPQLPKYLPLCREGRSLYLKTVGKIASTVAYVLEGPASQIPIHPLHSIIHPLTPLIVQMPLRNIWNQTSFAPYRRWLKGQRGSLSLYVLLCVRSKRLQGTTRQILR